MVGETKKSEKTEYHYQVYFFKYGSRKLNRKNGS